MRALVIQHMEKEHGGTLAEFLRKQGWLIEEARLHQGCRLNKTPGAYDLIVSMGGEMNVYEEDEYPFLAEETEFLRDAVTNGSRVIGICLGAQMIAKALGASVVSSPAKEVGWGAVNLTTAGVLDPLFDGCENPLRVFQWHEDMFNIPESGALLGYSDACPHQAFRFNRAYGLQFHVEVDADILNLWFADSPLRDNYVRTYYENEIELISQAELIYSNLLKQID